MGKLRVDHKCLAALKGTVRQIEGIIEKADAGVQYDYQSGEFLKQARVGFDHYGNKTAAPNMIALATRINEVALAEVLKENKRKTANELNAARVKLESLRAVLPSLAAKAAVELGSVAREIDEFAATLKDHP